MAPLYRPRRASSSLAAGAAALIGGAAAAGPDPVVPYTVTDAARIEASLTGAAGDPAEGARLFAAEPAGCARCHGLPGRGDGAAPDLAAIGARLSPGEIRLWLVAPEVLDPDLGAHARYRAGQRTGTTDPLYNGPLLTAAEIEHLVAYLARLDGVK